MTPLQYASVYAAKGWGVVPVPHRGKNPGAAGRQKLRLALVFLGYARREFCPGAFRTRLVRGAGPAAGGGGER